MIRSACRLFAAALAIVLIVSSAGAEPRPISGFVESEYPVLEKLYTDLHRSPELSLAEARTAKRLADELRKAEFGERDPFGDFDLLYGAARLQLKIIEVPIRYQARTYGSTNIDRWRHGWMLLKMSAWGLRTLKFI